VGIHSPHPDGNDEDDGERGGPSTSPGHRADVHARFPGRPMNWLDSFLQLRRGFPMESIAHESTKTLRAWKRSGSPSRSLRIRISSVFALHPPFKDSFCGRQYCRWDRCHARDSACFRLAGTARATDHMEGVLLISAPQHNVSAVPGADGMDFTQSQAPSPGLWRVRGFQVSDEGPSAQRLRKILSWRCLFRQSSS